MGTFRAAIYPIVRALVQALIPLELLPYGFDLPNAYSQLPTLYPLARGCPELHCLGDAQDVAIEVQDRASRITRVK